MKIAHCCLSFEYVDDMAYQENILPYMQKKLGHDVVVITGTIIDRAGMERYEVAPGKYTMNNGVDIIRLQPVKIPYFIENKLHIHRNVFNTLKKVKPDLIFIHEVNSLSLLQIIKYAKLTPAVRIMVDNHNDYFNSGRNWLSYHVLHKGIYKYLCSRINPYVEIFWGTLPIRCEFLNHVYGVPEEKIQFLPMGIDDTNIPYNEREKIRNEIRDKLNINEDDFVIITGGKIDSDKKIVELIDALKDMPIHVKLIVFGKPAANFVETYKKACINSIHVLNVGWVKSDLIYRYFFASDIACFPGGHSVLWEQAVACGIPGIFKYRRGMNHIDIGGNCLWMENADVETIRNNISKVYYDHNLYIEMKIAAESKGRNKFSYLEIAKKTITPIGEGM